MLIVITVNVYSDQNDNQPLFAMIISQIRVGNLCRAQEVGQTRPEDYLRIRKFQLDAQKQKL